jgi:hypothetical protein
VDLATGTRVGNTLMLRVCTRCQGFLPILQIGARMESLLGTIGLLVEELLEPAIPPHPDG